MAYQSRARTLFLASLLHSHPYNPWHYYIAVTGYAGVITLSLYFLLY
jgi:hypothetical protein